MVKNLKKIITQFQHFQAMLITTESSDSEFYNTMRILYGAIDGINRAARWELEQIFQRVKASKIEYDGSHALCVDTAGHYLDRFLADIRNMEFRSRFVNSTELGQNDFPEARTVDSLITALKVIRTVPDENNDFRIWSMANTDRHESCLFQYNLMINILTRISELLRQASVDWEQINQMANSDYNAENAWADQLLNNSRQANAVITDVIHCSTEYKNVVERGYELTKANLDESKKYLLHDFYLNYTEVLDLVWSELETIKFSIAYFEGLLTKYSRNDTSKLDMASSITVANSTQLEEVLGNILAKIDSHAWEPLKFRMRNSKLNIKEWYLSSLTAIGMHLNITEYFPVTFVDGGHRLQLDPIDYYVIYKPLGLNLWLEEKPLETFEDASTKILQSFQRNISLAIYDFRARLSSAKREALTALDHLIADVQSFYQQSHVDKDFIL